MTEAVSQLFISGLKPLYDSTAESLTFDLSQIKAKGGERCQIGMMLGAEFLMGKKPYTEGEGNTPRYSPDKIVIDLRTGAVNYTSLAGETHALQLPFKPAGVQDCLRQLHLLLLQRSLGELLTNQLALDGLQMSTDTEEKKQILNQFASFDHLTSDDPERLGFRLQLSQSEDGLRLSLADIDQNKAMSLWGTANEQALVGRVSQMLVYIMPLLKAEPDPTLEMAFLQLPLSPSQLAGVLAKNVATKTGIALIDQQGRILRAPHILNQSTWASPGGASKTRLCPLLSAMTEMTAESSALPASSSGWHRLTRQTPDITPVDFTDTVAPQLNWSHLKELEKSTGSTAGGVYVDGSTGKKWHIKWYKDEDWARSEVLASKLYLAVGVNAVERHLLTLDNQVCTVSEWVDFEVTSSTQFSKAEKELAHKGFCRRRMAGKLGC